MPTAASPSTPLSEISWMNIIKGLSDIPRCLLTSVPGSHSPWVGKAGKGSNRLDSRWNKPNEATVPVSTAAPLPKSRQTVKEDAHLSAPLSSLRFRTGLGLLAVLLVASIVLASGIGAVHVPALEIVGMLLNRAGLVHLSQTWPQSDEAIILQIRLPRVLAAALVGAALAVAGVLFQGLLRNPLADPYVIGTSGGAGLGATLGVLVSARFSVLGFGAVPALAFLGALGTMVLVYRLSRVAGRTPVVTLLLAGFAVSIILGYTMSFLLIVNDRLRLNTPFIYSWLLGGISVAHWAQVGTIAFVVAIGSALAFALARSLNALSLGEEYAQHLGISVEPHKAAIIAVGSLLTAAA